jgi:predicted MFS family arabinose efflux permease
VDRLREALRAARLPGVGSALATSALNGLTWGILGAFLAGGFVNRHAGYDGWIGALWFTDGVAWLAGSTLGGIIVARVATPERVLTSTMMTMVLAMGLFAWLDAGPVVTLVSFGVWVLLFGVASNTIVTLYTHHASERSPAVLFLDSALYKVAMFLGGVSGGIAVDVAGSYTAWSALLVTSSTLAVLPLALRPRTRPVARQRPAVANQAGRAES